MGTQTAEVFAELLTELGDQQRRLVEQLSGPGDEQTLLEAHKWLLSILQVATDTQVWADAAHPRFVEIVGPYKKWGGDNADAYYQHAPLDPKRTYRVRGKKGDAAYLSLTVYGGPRDGRYSERIVGTVNDRDDLAIAADGAFEVILGPDRPPGWDGAFLELESDAVVAITRDYLEDPVHGTRCTWHIEALDRPAQWREDDADLATRDLRAKATYEAVGARVIVAG